MLEPNIQTNKTITPSLKKFITESTFESKVQLNKVVEKSPKIIENKLESNFEKVEKIIAENFDLRYNVIANDVEFRNVDEKEFQPLNENNLYRFLQHNNIKFSQSNLSALLRSDFVQEYNPFNEYFENLVEWNQENEVDYINQFSSYVKAIDQERFQKHFKKMLVRVVACALNDKVFNKQAFILVHDKQNSGKSTFCRFLCPPTLKNYFSESFNMDKDSLISLSENLFINLDELSSLSKVELTTLKSMFSKDKVKIRRPYDKKPTATPRRCSFIGSTNKTEFLSDETGSVRWLCFEILEINWNYSNDINIDLIWSQAYALFKNGFNYLLTESELNENEFANEKHQQVTPEIDLIQTYLQPSKKDEDNSRFFTTTQIAEFLQEKLTNSSIRLNGQNLGKALKKSGFIKEQQYNGQYQVKGYYLKFISFNNNTN